MFSATAGPLKYAIFRWLWIASLASNIGSFMHGVGSAWLLTSLTASATIIALLPVANALPAVLLALPSGALADVMDRRRLLLISQSIMLTAAAVLGVLAWRDLVTPAVLLAATAMLACGSVLNSPAFASLAPDIVPRDELPQALVLNGLAFTGAMVVGPALGGAVVAASGPAAVFMINAVSFLGQMIVISRWRPAPRETKLPPEHVLGAVRAGLRYLRHARPLQIVLARVGAAAIAFGALFALLPLVARRQLELDAGGFGLLFGAMGIGAVAGAFIIPRVRERTSLDVVVAGSSIAMAFAMLVLALADSLRPALAGLVVGGVGQMGLMSSMNLAAQRVLPAWVRGRGLAVYQLTFQLAVAIGALLWGFVATASSPSTALMISAALLVATIGLTPWLRLGPLLEMDAVTGRWPTPHIALVPDPEDGPVLVTSEYEVLPEDVRAFAVAMAALGVVRRRDGALRWTCWADLTTPGRYFETYVVASWAEHLRQRERSTPADRDRWLAVRKFHRGEGEDGVIVRWHLPLRPGHEPPSALPSTDDLLP